MEEKYNFVATIIKRIFYNPESCWGVYTFSSEEDIPHLTPQIVDDFMGAGCNATKEIKEGMLCGKMQELKEGASYHITATVVENKKYGYQYNPIAVTSLVPKTQEQSVLFLSSFLSENISKNLIAAYPDLIKSVVDNSDFNIDCSKVYGVSNIKWEQIKHKIIENYALTDLINLLSPLGVTFNMIKKLLDTEPNSQLLIQKINENPYVLTNIRGIGWKKVDTLALRLKPESKNTRERLCAFVDYYLSELAEGDGDTLTSISDLKTQIANNVPSCMSHFEWLLSQSNFVKIVDDHIGLVKYYDMEKYIFNELKRRNNIKPSSFFSDTDIEAGIERAEEEQGFTYTPQQKNAIHRLLSQNIGLLVGYAGVGKSSISRGIVWTYRLKHLPISACALSAMAAIRLENSANVQSSTIHRMLGWNGKSYLFNKDNKLNTNLILLDEATMCNLSLIKAIIDAAPDTARIIFVFDDGQLPPIGSGNIASDLLKYFDEDSKAVLDKVMRQANESAVLNDANKVRVGLNPVKESVNGWVSHGDKKDLIYGFFEDKNKLHAIALKTYLKQIEEDIDNTLFVCPKKEGLNSVSRFNQEIQDMIFDKSVASITCGDKEFKLGARVMCTKNDSERGVFNGTMGKITNICGDKCDIDFKLPNGESVNTTYNKSELLSDIELGYCITIHKSQGGGFDNVIIVLDKSSYIMLDKTILYTAITRAKKRALVLSQPDAFLQCLRGNHAKRNTWSNILRGSFD